MGFDRPLFQQFRSAANEYAGCKIGAGREDAWKEFKPFSDAEIVAVGCSFAMVCPRCLRWF
eukprot:2958098-Prymnesium_polylepis.1